MSDAWTTEYADRVFSKMILARDPTCVRCRWRPATDTSHFYERAKSSVRYNPLNADGACRFCHDYWHAHRNNYKQFKLKQIGWRLLIALERASVTVMSREDALAKFKKNVENSEVK